MCIPHGASTKKDNGFIKDKPKKHIEKVSQDIFEKGDPSFIDERHFQDKKDTNNKSFFSSLFDN
ncbi:hypothetical protein N9A28_04580 [Sulfurimonas sp.]|nr:hypothetical protein [Sulfurimonas sp.]